MRKRLVKIGQRVFRPLIKSGVHKGKPKCIVKGCNKPAQNKGEKRKDGTIIYRARCVKHHYLDIAQKNGYDSVADLKNTWHPYRRNRLDFCENKDGRLGFICTTNIVDNSMLEVDHMNNDHSDNRKVNLQTICSCCHRYKTRYFGHYSSISGIKKAFKKNTQNTKQKRKKSV